MSPMLLCRSQIRYSRVTRAPLLPGPQLMTIMTKHNAALNADNVKLREKAERMAGDDQSFPGSEASALDMDSPMKTVMDSLRQMQARRAHTRQDTPVDSRPRQSRAGPTSRRVHPLSPFHFAADGPVAPPLED